ncbi:JAB domain-containing protein [Altibacter sp. HG106]|uniref:JAB domain-containing protein n=1 Tax=Altibacter sp. HG106 TaxID=3023937 RepID=UPI002350BBB3|nr:JAB domain-containing protein [Altibacter sp. HG106]MDC7995512.1 JAB domain-containing protein [Altibacter sp. HG106]
MIHNISEIEIVYKPSKLSNTLKIKSSLTAYKVIKSNWNSDTIELFEEFKVVLLNNSNEVLGIYTLSKGGYTGTIVDLRILFAILLKSAAVAFITVHNHPSSILKPSQSDIQIYKKIEKVAQFHDISYLDNLIITNQGYVSFKDDGIHNL